MSIVLNYKPFMLNAVTDNHDLRSTYYTVKYLDITLQVPYDRHFNEAVEDTVELT